MARTENRQTGRTTRMVEEAIDLANKGRAVYILADNYNHAENIRELFGEDPETYGIKIETEGDLGNFDWQTLSLRGAHKNCIVLIDHYTIENKFSRIIEALHKYDKRN